MAGISVQTLKGNNYSPNRNKFNGIEETKDLGLNQYDAFYRTLDPQIGRFLQVDPKIESADGVTPYSAMLNNPVRNADPLGDSTIPGAGFWRNAWEGIKDGGKQTLGFIKSLGTVEGWKNLATGINNLNPFGVSTPEKAQWQQETAQNIVEGVKNIPNMTKDDWGHAVSSPFFSASVS